MPLIIRKSNARLERYELLKIDDVIDHVMLKLPKSVECTYCMEFNLTKYMKIKNVLNYTMFILS